MQYLEKTVLQRKKSEVTQKGVERLAGQTARLTIADLERIVQQAAVIAAQNASPLTDEILAEAFERFRMGRGERDSEQGCAPAYCSTRSWPCAHFLAGR